MALVFLILFSRKALLKVTVYEMIMKLQYFKEVFKVKKKSPGLLQFSSVAQSCPTLCDPMNHSTPGLPVHHQLLGFTQSHVHRVGDAIQPSHPLSSPSLPAPNPSQHQGLLQWVNSSHEVAKVHIAYLKKISFIETELIYNVVLVSGTQRSDSVMC